MLKKIDINKEPFELIGKTLLSHYNHILNGSDSDR